MRYLISAVVILFALGVARAFVFTVDPTEYVYVTEFGRHVATYDGALDRDAGLHFCLPWPIQSIQRLDRRLQYFDLPETELLTHDAAGKTVDKTLIVNVYVCWRIADKDAVDRFIRGLGTQEYARSVLEKRLNSQVGAAIGQIGLDDLISTQDLVDQPKVKKVEFKMEELRGKLLAQLRGPLERDYGIELNDLRLRRFNHPAGEVRQAIFDRIKSERDKKVKEFVSDGEKQAKDIASETDKKVKDLIAEAEKNAEIVRGGAKAEADRIRNQAHSKDPEFYAFLKRLEFYQHMLGENKTLLLLSTHRPLFDQLFSPPRLNDAAPSNGSKDQPPRKEEDKK